MTWWAWGRAALLGVAVAEAVALTAGGPRWRAAGEPAMYELTFAADGAACYALAERGGATVVRALDARTGVARTTRLALPPGLSKDRIAVFAAGGRRVVVCDVEPTAELTYVWRLFDPETGSLVAGPLAGMPRLVGSMTSADGYWNRLQFAGSDKEPDRFGDPVSADGRWILCRREAGVEVLAVPAATTAVRIADRPAEAVAWVAFAADAPRVLVRWRRTADDSWADRHDAVEVIDLPSGRVVRRVALPPSPGFWERGGLRGDRLTLVEHPAFGETVVAAFDLATDPPTGGRYFAFNTAGDDVGHDLHEGAGWFAVQTVGTPPPWPPVLDRVRDWLRERAGGMAGDGGMVTAQVAVFDADGRPRSRLAGPLPTAVAVAPDGRTVAARDDAGRVELWATAPPSPWPWAITAGAAACVAWAALERRRARRASG